MVTHLVLGGQGKGWNFWREDHGDAVTLDVAFFAVEPRANIEQNILAEFPRDCKHITVADWKVHKKVLVDEFKLELEVRRRRCAEIRQPKFSDTACSDVLTDTNETNFYLDDGWPCGHHQIVGCSCDIQSRQCDCLSDTKNRVNK